MSVSVTFLGGLGEIGRNCAAVEVKGKIALVDVGLMFPEEDMLGVDLVFPDWSWLVDRSRDVSFVVITGLSGAGKSYGGTDGYRFVNGVLQRLAAGLRPQEVAASRQTA